MCVYLVYHMKVEVKTNEYSFNNLFYPVFRLVQAPIFYVLISNMSFSYCIWPFESEIQWNIEMLTSSTLDIQLHLDDGSVIECPHNVVVRITPGNDGISLSIMMYKQSMCHPSIRLVKFLMVPLTTDDGTDITTGGYNKDMDKIF